MTTPTTADRLLDAQVAWVVGEVTGDRLGEVIERVVDELLAAATEVQLGEVLSADAAMDVVRLLLRRVPPSQAVTAGVGAMADQLHAGPDIPATPGDLADREELAAVVDHALALTPLLEGTLDRLTESPLVGQLATRFISRLVVDVLEANRSMTKKIPGVGSLMSLGTSAATKMVGAADKQVQSLLGGDLGGKGTAMAVRRLNSVVLSTIQDPRFRGAMLEVWDTLADDPINGVDGTVPRDDIRGFAAAVHRMAVTAAPTAPVDAFLTAWVQALFVRHGDDTVADMLTAVGVDRDDILTMAMALVPAVVAAAVADGRLERALRARLAPFYASPAVAAILADELG